MISPERRVRRNVWVVVSFTGVNGATRQITQPVDNQSKRISTVLSPQPDENAIHRRHASECATHLLTRRPPFRTHNESAKMATGKGVL